MFLVTSCSCCGHAVDQVFNLALTLEPMLNGHGSRLDKLFLLLIHLRVLFKEPNQF